LSNRLETMTKRIGRYELQEELGRGGFGRVYRAYDPTMKRLVAIKTLTAAGEPEMLRRFRNEATAAGRLRHQNIVIIYDFGEQDGTPYLVMELLDGEDLDKIISENRRLKLLQRVDIMMQVAAGLHQAHLGGIVHRDVKPANIMVLPDGTAKVLDFGIALLSQANTASRLTPQGSMLGTLTFMAPEQFSGAAPGVLTDIFAYGVTFYKLLTRQHPFYAPEVAELMHKIVTASPVPLRQINPGCPEALEEAVSKMLAKDPAARYQSFEEVRFDLSPVMRDLAKAAAEKLVAQGRTSLDAGQLDEAQRALQQALEFDPGSQDARGLREKVQRLLKDRAVRPQIIALTAGAREDLHGRRFEEAMQKLESALQLDKSDAELAALLAQAREGLAQAQRANRLVDEAKRALQEGELKVAASRLDEATVLDPRQPEAATLLSTVQVRIEKQERQLQEAEEAAPAPDIKPVEPKARTPWGRILTSAGATFLGIGVIAAAVFLISRQPTPKPPVVNHVAPVAVTREAEIKPPPEPRISTRLPEPELKKPAVETQTAKTITHPVLIEPVVKPKLPNRPNEQDQLQKAEITVNADVAGALVKADQNGVLRSLEALSRAIHEKSVALLKQEWPSISAADLERWEDKFRNAESISLDLQPGTPQISGTSARVECRSTTREHYAGAADPYRDERTVRVTLEKMGGEWKITSLR
jgi:tetratricopeptide (TPR) repeat protein